MYWNQIWIYVINLPGFSALLGFKAPFQGDGESVLDPGTTVLLTNLMPTAISVRRAKITRSEISTLKITIKSKKATKELHLNLSRS